MFHVVKKYMAHPVGVVGVRGLSTSRIFQSPAGDCSKLGNDWPGHSEAPDSIHILGLGAVGIFVAYSLRAVPDPPNVTLLFHNNKYMHAWENERMQMQLRRGSETFTTKNYAVEIVGETTRRDKAESAPPIRNLIVATKCGSTVEALQKIIHRLSSQSTIVFLQNGMGIVEEVNQMVFPDPQFRPNYLVGINSHGIVKSSGNAGARLFSVEHTGFGQIILSLILPETITSQDGLGSKDSNRELSTVNISHPQRLLRRLIQTSALAAIDTPAPHGIFLAQFEKLVVNAVINPLTGLHDIQNGHILEARFADEVTAILSEISALALHLPDLSFLTTAEREDLFTVDRLRRLVIQVATKTAHNSSSMREDIRGGRETEIAYINGYIVRNGKACGVPCPTNERLLEQIMAFTAKT